MLTHPTSEAASLYHKARRLALHLSRKSVSDPATDWEDLFQTVYLKCSSHVATKELQLDDSEFLSLFNRSYRNALSDLWRRHKRGRFPTSLDQLRSDSGFEVAAPEAVDRSPQIQLCKRMVGLVDSHRDPISRWAGQAFISVHLEGRKFSQKAIIEKAKLNGLSVSQSQVSKKAKAMRRMLRECFEGQIDDLFQ